VPVMIEPVPQTAKPTSTHRVRAHRERRRLAVRNVKVSVSKTSIEALVRMGYLAEAQQQDVSAIQKAVQTFVADAPFMP